jgi:hypothetical protein
MARSVTVRDRGWRDGSSSGEALSGVASSVADGVAARDAFMLQRSPSSATAAAGCLLGQHGSSAAGAVLEQHDDFVAFAAS